MAHSGDELVRRLLAGEDYDIAGDLLSAFYHGFPVSNLRLLLRSVDDNAVKSGVWIASELGEKAAPLIEDLSRLLNHPLVYVRFFALDTILLCASGAHSVEIARSVALVLDPDSGVQWKAMRFVSRATEEQLSAGLNSLDNPLKDRVRWLLSVDQPDEIVAALNSADDLVRVFGVVAAARSCDQDSTPLAFAASSSDSVISSFAEEELLERGV